MGDGCKHLNNFKVTKGIQPYKTIFSFFVACISDEARKIKVRFRSKEYNSLYGWNESNLKNIASVYFLLFFKI